MPANYRATVARRKKIARVDSSNLNRHLWALIDSDRHHRAPYRRQWKQIDAYRHQDINATCCIARTYVIFRPRKTRKAPIPTNIRAWWDLRCFLKSQACSLKPGAQRPEWKARRAIDGRLILERRVRRGRRENCPQIYQITQTSNGQGTCGNHKRSLARSFLKPQASSAATRREKQAKNGTHEES